MIYIHYCSVCNKTFALNGHKSFCPKCYASIRELDITYLKYLTLTKEERSAFINLSIIEENPCQYNKNP